MFLNDLSRIILITAMLGEGCVLLENQTPLRGGDKPRKQKTYLLCRPRGGLNDTLCQIEVCWRYAARFHRTLVVDTRNSGLHGDFSDFFRQREDSTETIFHLSEDTMEFLNNLRCFPIEMRGRLGELDLARWASPNWVMKDTSIPITFDFSKDYDDPLLIHEQWGGGSLSFYVVEKLAIADDLQPIVADRLRQFNDVYYAVHVRNTDIKTDYKKLFAQIAPKVKNKRLLVCSDDTSVIQYARDFFNSSQVLVSSRPPDTKGIAIHEGRFGDRKENSIDAIVDLIALGKAEKVFFTSVTDGYPSGFSALAAHLSRNKYVLDELLQIPRIDFSLTKWRLKQYMRRLYYGDRRFEFGSDGG